LGRALDALVAWRAQAGPAQKRARVSWGVKGDQAYVEWLEQRLSREDLPDNRTESLALPLLARVALAHGGSFSVDATLDLCVSLRWPIDASSTKEGEP
jgi:hypothetical protein